MPNSENIVTDRQYGARICPHRPGNQGCVLL